MMIQAAPRILVAWGIDLIVSASHSVSLQLPIPRGRLNGEAFMKMLLVEDQEAQILIMQEAAKGLPDELTLNAVFDGGEATDYLLGQGPYSNRSKFPFPDLLVTDLNMPGMDGLELLRWLKEHPEWAQMPKVVLSNSCSHEEITQAYELGANGCLKKPAGLTDSKAVLMVIQSYWHSCVQE
jgi:CheY-like chemotaxis protein